MSIPTLTDNGETKGRRKRGLDEQRWRAPLLALFFSLVLILILSLLPGLWTPNCAWQARAGALMTSCSFLWKPQAL